MFLKNAVSGSPISQHQAQELLEIFHQELSFLDGSKQKARSPTLLFSSEARKQKTIQENLRKDIHKKNEKIETLLKQFEKNENFCKILATLITTTDNRFSEERKCSDEPLFQRFYSSESFRNLLTEDIRSAFDSTTAAEKKSSAAAYFGFGGKSRIPTADKQVTTGQDFGNR
jgi:hypothetical protein